MLAPLTILLACGIATWWGSGSVPPTEAQGGFPITQQGPPLNRVGINNTAPTVALDVNGNTRIVGNATVTGTMIATAFQGNGALLTNLPATAAGPIAIQ